MINICDFNNHWLLKDYYGKKQQLKGQGFDWLLLSIDYLYDLPLLSIDYGFWWCIIKPVDW